MRRKARKNQSFHGCSLFLNGLKQLNMHAQCSVQVKFKTQTTDVTLHARADFERFIWNINKIKIHTHTSWYEWLVSEYHSGLKTAPFCRTAEARTDHRYQHVAKVETMVWSVMFPKSVTLVSPSFSDVHFVAGPACEGINHRTRIFGKNLKTFDYSSLRKRVIAWDPN